MIAWIWARTVKSPNPAVNAHVPLVHSFVLSKKRGRETWAKPIVEGNIVRFEVTQGTPPKGQDGTVARTGAICVISGTPIPFEYIREEGKAGRMSAMLMTIVIDGQNGRSYCTPERVHSQIANVPIPSDVPNTELPEQALARLYPFGGQKKEGAVS